MLKETLFPQSSPQSFEASFARDVLEALEHEISFLEGLFSQPELFKSLTDLYSLRFLALRQHLERGASEQSDKLFEDLKLNSREKEETLEKNLFLAHDPEDDVYKSYSLAALKKANLDLEEFSKRLKDQIFSTRSTSRLNLFESLSELLSSAKPFLDRVVPSFEPVNRYLKVIPLPYREEMDSWLKLPPEFVLAEQLCLGKIYLEYTPTVLNPWVDEGLLVDSTWDFRHTPLVRTSPIIHRFQFDVKAFFKSSSGERVSLGGLSLEGADQEPPVHDTLAHFAYDTLLSPASAAVQMVSAWRCSTPTASWQTSLDLEGKRLELLGEIKKKLKAFRQQNSRNDQVKISARELDLAKGLILSFARHGDLSLDLVNQAESLPFSEELIEIDPLLRFDQRPWPQARLKRIGEITVALSEHRLLAALKSRRTFLETMILRIEGYDFQPSLDVGLKGGALDLEKRIESIQKQNEQLLQMLKEFVRDDENLKNKSLQNLVEDL